MRALLFLALIYPAMASANWLTGNDLLARCESENSYDLRECIGYLRGVMDAHVALREWEGFMPKYCIPEGVTLGQIEAIVVKRLKENPERRHLIASSLVLNALNNAFMPPLKFENGEPAFYCP